MYVHNYLKISDIKLPRRLHYGMVLSTLFDTTKAFKMCLRSLT